MRVPRAIFADSPVFRDMFTMPQAEDTITDGDSDDHPLKLMSVRADDFKLFVRAVVPQYVVKPLNLDLTI
jgi:hypothetical protein